MLGTKVVKVIKMGKKKMKVVLKMLSNLAIGLLIDKSIY